MLLRIAEEVCLAIAAIPALMFLVNIFLYRRPAASPKGRMRVSVLIPARNEERSIEMCVRSVLLNRDAELEVIVLDDHSEDRTAALVDQIAKEDPRVRLEKAPPLPEGWCGKQHACFVLASIASSPIFCFLDADVRVSSDCFARLADQLVSQKLNLLSGFPLQETETLVEQMLIPLMHFVLLGFLPIIGMRKSADPAYSAGCGQLMVVDREGYRVAGGHAAIRSSRHDGISLPRAFRKAGLRTDLCDVTDLASCRMYRSGSEVFAGLSKNATEGLAAPARIVPFTLILTAGQVIPPALFLVHPNWITGLAVLLSYLPRGLATFRFMQSFIGALLHPLAVLLLLGIQWVALIRCWLGMPSTWKGRSYVPGTAS